MNLIQSKTGQSTLVKGAIIGAAIVILVAAVFFMHQQGAAKGSIANGDIVTLKYSVFFAGNKSLAMLEKELKIKIGNATISQAFDNNLIGLKAGDKKTFQLAAADAFGKYELGLVQQYPRYKTIDRALEMLYAEAQTTIDPQYNLTKGATVRFQTWPWPELLKNVNATSVVLYHEPVLNSLYVDPYILVWPIKVTNITATTITSEFMPKIGSVTYDANFGNGKVVDLGDDKVTVDYNHPLAGNDIVFEVQIEVVQKQA